jgi:hypothetical protein
VSQAVVDRELHDGTISKTRRAPAAILTVVGGRKPIACKYDGGLSGRAENACDSFGAIGRGGLGQYLFNVPLDRGLGQEKPLCDLGAGHSVGYQAKDLELAGGEWRARSRSWLGCGSERQLLKLDRSAFEVEGRGLKCFLGDLGIGDVLGDPNHTDRLTRFIHHHLSSVAEGPHSAVSADSPVLERE